MNNTQKQKTKTKTKILNILLFFRINIISEYTDNQ